MHKLLVSQQVFGEYDVQVCRPGRWKNGRKGDGAVSSCLSAMKEKCKKEKTKDKAEIKHNPLRKEMELKMLPK